MQSTGTSSRRRTLLFGGSFDPVHLGHEYIIRRALECTDYERIVVMPANRSNFKQDSRPASNEDRLAMLHLALDGLDAGDKEVIISTWELEKGGVSYSFDTVTAMYSLYGIEGRLGFLMGDDLLEGLSRWHRYSELKEMVDFVCFTRNGGAARGPEDANILFFDVPPFEASSSAVRAGQLDGLHPSVSKYIRNHGLYYAGENRQGD